VLLSCGPRAKFDAEKAPRLREEPTGLIDGGVPTAAVDLAQLRFIGFTGLSVLMAGQSACSSGEASSPCGLPARVL
jgi:anti-anti-sigma regulatory factor